MHLTDQQKYCKLDTAGEELLNPPRAEAINKLGLSARAYDRILKVGRTIADLSASEMIRPVHSSDFFQFWQLI